MHHRSRASPTLPVSACSSARLSTEPQPIHLTLAKHSCLLNGPTDGGWIGTLTGARPTKPAEARLPSLGGVGVCHVRVACIVWGYATQQSTELVHSGGARHADQIKRCEPTLLSFRLCWVARAFRVCMSAKSAEVGNNYPGPGLQTGRRSSTVRDACPRRDAAWLCTVGPTHWSN